MEEGELARLLIDNGLTNGVRLACIGVEEPSLLRKLADVVGSNGVVYAVEKDKDRLAAVEEIVRNGYDNVKPFYAPLLERIPYLPNNWFNLVLLYHTPERVSPYYLTLLNETHRLLKHGGKAIVVSRVKGLLSREGVEEKELDKAISTTSFKLEHKIKKAKELVVILTRVEPEE